MKLRVVHLVRKLEKIDRDLEELENIRGRVQEDRDYAGRLRESLTEESRRLKDLRGRILTQVIKVPADSSLEAGASRKQKPAAAPRKASRKQSASREPEIILPGKSSSARKSAPESTMAQKDQEDTPAAPVVAPAAGKTARGKSKSRSAAAGKPAANQDSAPAESFKFKYE